MPYRLEKAATARSKCRGAYPCGEDFKIEKGEARLGVLVDIKGHQSFHWRHLWCVTPKVWGNIKAEMGDDPTDVDGYEELDEEDQAIFSKAYEEGSIDKDDAPERLQKGWKKNAKARDRKKKETAKKNKREKKMRECADKGIPYESSEDEEEDVKEEDDSDDEEEQEEKKPVVDAKTTPKGKGKAKAKAETSPATPKTPKSPKASTSAAANKKKKKPAAKSVKKQDSDDDDDADVGDITEEEDEDEMSDLGDTSEEDVKPAAKGKGKGKPQARASTSSTSRRRGTKRKQDSEDESDEEDGGTSEEEVMPKGKDRSGGRATKQATGPSVASSSQSPPAKSPRGVRGGQARGGRGGRDGQARGRGRGGARGGRKSASKRSPEVDADGEERKPVVKTEANGADDTIPSSSLTSLAPTEPEEDVKPKIKKGAKKVKKEVS